MATTKNNETAISCLQHAIEDTQGSIRAYDAKAEVLGVLLTVAIGITNFSLLPELNGYAKAVLISSWAVSLVAVAFLGLVLHPKANEFKAIRFGTYSPKGTYFLYKVTSSPENTVSSLAERVKETDWVEELTYESMKLSLIRDRKHKWFVLALQATGVMLLFILIAILMGALCG